ncbi:phosphatase PAP2 family protein [Rhizobium sp. C1]|uniref:phosphatase PAP2 family protein n=1 Tax=Rhizobium sp. C1 TaxID=1349799 RepID=UPI001E5C57DA|nr:phosphatase PAP2 family protein [Rhizobium sp. C1]MCD2178851.1 phosphatase PAP2 family protein [Rhizobium sp. C1]
MLSTGFFRADIASAAKQGRSEAVSEPSWAAFFSIASIYTLMAGMIWPALFWRMVLLTSQEMLVFSLACLLLALCVEAVVKSPRRPLDFILEKLRRKGSLIICGLTLLVLGISAYSTYKVNIPNIVPYYADPYFAAIDKAVYGRNAWRAFHELPPQAGLLIDFFYTRVWPGLLLFGVLGGLLFVEGRTLHRYAWGLFFVYAVMGTLVATLFASVGPIFYMDFYPHAPEFTRLKPALLENPYISDILTYSNYLLDSYQSKQLGFATGISAFPSVHVAVATLSAWYMTGFGRRWAVLGWTNAVIIQYGSVYSGWHYAIDGDVSLVAVSIFWIVTSRILGLPLLPPART